VCRSTLINPSNGCVPVDLFGFESPSAAAMGYYLGTAAADLTDRQVDVAVNFSGNLFPMWDGPASLAAGGEYRSESLAQSVDPISLRKGFAFSNPQPLGGSMSVSEGYVETVVPLARNRPFAKNLELDVAGRVTRYNTSGTVETWKLGLNYAPVRDFRLRLTRSRDIRAPNITELDSPLSETTAASPVVDPLNNRAVNVETFSSGNRDLVPEIAYTGTAGLVFEPTQVKGLSASLDYYHIDVGGGITTLGLQSILNGCHGGDAQMCSAITRNASGQLISIDSAYFNLNRITTSGLDFDVEYRTELSDLRSGWRGVWELRALGNEIRHYYVNTGTSTVDYVGDLAIYQIPKWSWDLSSLYSLDGWTGLVDATYLSGGKDQVALDKLLANNDVGGVWYLDTGIQKSFVAGPSEMTVYLNIRNLLNREPPFAFRLGGGINGGPAYDRIGRYFKLGIRVAL
jgi:outer membrane receptor protein involved in Fe transport